MNGNVRRWIRQSVKMLGLAEIALLVRDNLIPAGRQHKDLSRRFYAQFITSGDLCFDIGAHLGDRTGAFAALGANVVAVEPQPRCVQYLNVRFRNNPRVTILQNGVADQHGELTLYLNRESSMSTMSQEQISAITNRSEFSQERWDRSLQVAVTTLDALIETYGVPTFCKIDVEGFEDRVLKGLSRPIKALSFEYTPENIGVALASIEHLATLGTFEFNYSVSETLSWSLSQRVDHIEISRILQRLTTAGSGGDVYAFLMNPDA